MLYKIAMEPAQIEALYGWFCNTPDAAAVLIDADRHGQDDQDGTIYVGQGDARATITPDGTITEED